MLKSWFHLFVILSLFAASPVVARVVDTQEDYLRLTDFDEHQRRQAEFNKRRLTDVSEVEKARRNWEDAQKKSLVDYKEWKRKQVASAAEDSDDYRQYLKAEALVQKRIEDLRQEFLSQRNKVREKFSASVKVTELEELGINIDPARVPWEKRNVLAEKGKPSSGARPSGGSPSFNRPNQGNDFIPPEFDSPPPPMPSAPPPPEFFEPDIPPPPPPPDGGFDIPPPPNFDDGAPPPIFDDEF